MALLFVALLVGVHELSVVLGSTTVHTTYGPVQGGSVDVPGYGEVVAFLGIPYAAPPTSALRWKPPQAHKGWTSVFQANSFSAICPQPVSDPKLNVSEDCLSLNVWVPASAVARGNVAGAGLHTMFWIHGGGYVNGGNNELAYRGQFMAARENVIVVNINYRLGNMGFYAHRYLAKEDPSFPSTGNYGLLDQRFALKWIRANLKSFGGNGRVTIFGESAGASSVCFHLVMPKSFGLYSNAIAESSACLGEVWDLDMAEDYGEVVQGKLGCNSTDPSQVLECLRSRSWQELIALNSDNVAATIDGYELLEFPYVSMQKGAFNKVPLLAGNCAAEGSGFIFGPYHSPVPQSDYRAVVQRRFPAHIVEPLLDLYPCAVFNASDCRYALVHMFGDTELLCPTDMMSLAAGNSPDSPNTYAYIFQHHPSWASNVTVPGAYHGSEIEFVFSTLELVHPECSPAEVTLAHAMTHMWATFGKTNAPADNATWPAFHNSTKYGRLSLDVGGQFPVLHNYKATTCAAMAANVFVLGPPLQILS